MKVLVLYTRLTNYWMACLEKAVEQNGMEFLVFRDEPSDQAPFQLTDLTGIKLHSNKELIGKSLPQLLSDFPADLVYVAGWSNKDYLKITLAYKKAGATTVMGMDNHWTGSLKQQLASLFNYQLVRKYVDHIWIPGEPQLKFARKLGFPEDRINLGLYCADERLFEPIQRPVKQEKFLFVGRLVKHKGLTVLFEALNQLISEGIDFQMEIVGNGPLEGEIPQHPAIKHQPFIPPEDLPKKLAEAGVFILPSNYEAWGVVIHEAVQAGMPVISTYETGACSQFVHSGVNGGLFRTGDSKGLAQWIRTYIAMSEESYLKQVGHSRHLSGLLRREIWANTLNDMYLNKKGS